MSEHEAHHALSITKVISDRDMRNAVINVESITMVDMLRTLLDEAEKQGIDIELGTLRFTRWKDEYMPHTTSYRLSGEAR